MASQGRARKLFGTSVALSMVTLGACGAAQGRDDPARSSRPHGAGALAAITQLAGGFVSPGFERGVETVAVSAQDPSGIASVRAAVDGRTMTQSGSCGNVIACLGRNQSIDREVLRLDTRGVADGRHICSVIVRDVLGATTTRSWQCWIDNTPPSASLSRPAGDTSRTISFTDVSDSGSGIDPQAFEPQYSLNGGRSWATMAGSYDPAGRSYTAEVPSAVRPRAGVLVRLEEADQVGNTFTTPATGVTLAGASVRGVAPQIPNYRELVLHTPGLQDFWPLDDGPGSTAARDLTGSAPGIYAYAAPGLGLAGAPDRAQYTSTEFAGTPNYEQPASTDHRLEVVGAGQEPGAFTIELWLRPQRGGDPSGYLVGKNSIANGYYLYLDDRREVVFGIGSGGRYARVVSAPLTAGRWHYVAATLSGNGLLTEYLDGARTGRVRARIRPAPNQGSFTIAAEQGGGDDYSGALADAAVYSRALGGDEIASRFLAGTGRLPERRAVERRRGGRTVSFGYNDASAYIYTPALFTSGVVPGLIAGSGANIDRVPAGWYWGIRATNPVYEKIYRADRARHLRLLWVLTGYFAPNGGCNAPQGEECALISQAYQSYASYAADMARTYPGSMIEVWNEESFPISWWPYGASGVDQYARLLELTYKTVKRVSPRTTVVMGGIGSDAAPVYLTRLFRLGAMRFSDAINVHLYPWPPGTDNFTDPMKVLREIERTRAAFRDRKPIWITETGASTVPQSSSETSQVDAVRQSDDLRHYYSLLSSDPEVTMVLFHTLLGQPFNLSNSESGYPVVRLAGSRAVPQPAYCALAAARAGPIAC